MPDFLLEIGTEEIPARMMDSAWQEMSKRIVELLVRESLFKPTTAQATDTTEMPEMVFHLCATPRRLALVVPNVATTQADVTEQLTGPATKVAYKDGQPTPAAHAFAKKAGVDVSQLQKVTTPKGEYLTASVTNKGKPAAQVLTELLPKEIASIYWPKNMYWRAGKPERFVRPVRWIVAMLDGEIIPLEFAGIKAGNQSRGHRILGPAQVLIASPAKYVETMQGAHVTAVSADREHKIRKALDAATRTVPDARWREDAELLKTVVNLTEWPSAILGSFDKEYLSLPEEVLVTVMRDHQKYFAVEDAAGKLAPHFLAVLNTDGDPDGLIRHGNERVLRARFNDARFFWDTDQKTPLVNRVEMLKAVTFQKDLGSYAAKAERMAALAGKLCSVLAASGLKVDVNAVEQAARLAKTDLTAELVKEFTELQGIVGGLYAGAQGLPENVATAIYDQYKPASTEDSVPRTLEGAVLSIADKADSIAGMFALGLVPSGSKDPFALRRQANGIVKTIVEHKLPLSLSRFMAAAREQYSGSEAEKKFTLSGAAYVQAVRGFFRERLEFYLRDVLGLAYDVVNAALAAGADDVVDAVARSGAVAKVRPSSDFESISVAFKRMKNILRQAAETNKKIAEPFDPSALKDEEEKKLADAVPQVAKKVRELSASRQYEPALIEISRLRPAIDAFFDKVMVMVEDEDLRAQRLGLLKTLVNEFSSIADFSEIAAS
ncbi:MAG: glycyl-tRNA synthetase beta chain [Candidatus Angelobacter sp.]|nr:glycyl-tRNA synthetase beta chain [Candidatus Angelobacter sp.]